MRYLYLALTLVFVLACAEGLPTDAQPVAGSVAPAPRPLLCKMPAQDVLRKLSVFCYATRVPKESSWGQTLYDMSCSEPIYYWTGERISTGVRYSTVWSVWTEFSKSLSNRVGINTRDAFGRPKKTVNTTLCDVTIPEGI